MLMTDLNRPTALDSEIFHCSRPVLYTQVSMISTVERTAVLYMTKIWSKPASSTLPHLSTSVVMTTGMMLGSVMYQMDLSLLAPSICAAS